MSENNKPQGDAEVIEGIVVGVDGSDQGLCALKWAAQEAKRRGSVLNIVTAYTIPVFAASSMDAGYATLDDQLIRNGAEEVVRQARATITDTDITVRTYIESGDPCRGAAGFEPPGRTRRGRHPRPRRLRGQAARLGFQRASGTRQVPDGRGSTVRVPSGTRMLRRSRTGSLSASMDRTGPAWPCWWPPNWRPPGA